jgi:hypothetical protein
VSRAFENALIDSLKRIDDDDAARLVSEQAFAELEQAVLAMPPAPVRRRREGRTRKRGAARQPMFALAVAATVAAILLAATGVFSDDGPAAVQPADAAILHGAVAVLAHPGTIVIESYRGIARLSPKPPAEQTTTRFSARKIIETPVGKGAQNELDLEVPAGSRVEIGEVNGNNELYDPKNDTVYMSSQFGSDITKGPRPGSYIYTLPKTFYPPGASGPVTPPLTITGAQANALRDGTAHVLDLPDNGRPTAAHLKISAILRNPVETAEIRAQLKAGQFTVSGTITIDGRQAIKLTGLHRNPIREYDVAPGTYDPIREVARQPGNVTIVTYSEYRVLPDTATDARFLNLALRHPNARVDRNHGDYVSAARRLLNGG